jgi:hypothetical protein
LVSYYVFDVAALGEAWRTAGWAGVMAGLNGIWRVADFWLWAYVIFVVSNSMTPSESDRQPWVMAGIYLGIALLVVWLFGGFAALTGAFLDEVAGALQVLTLGFLFTLAMNAIIAVFLWLMEAVLIQAQRSQGNE